VLLIDRSPEETLLYFVTKETRHYVRPCLWQQNWRLWEVHLDVCWTTRYEKQSEVLTNGNFLQVTTFELPRRCNIIKKLKSKFILQVYQNMFLYSQHNVSVPPYRQLVTHHQVTTTTSSQFRSSHAPIGCFKNIFTLSRKANGTTVVSAVTRERSQLWRLRLSHWDKWQMFVCTLTAQSTACALQMYLLTFQLAKSNLLSLSKQ
jgi:hypothetical protein